MAGKVDHIQRPQPPWRDLRKSECGQDEPDRLISRAEFYDRVVAQGQQRAAMSICMTCWHTAQRHSGYGTATKDQERHQFINAWEHDPTQVLRRDCNRMENATLSKELAVLSMLVDAHRDEFDAAMAGLEQATTMDQLRAQRAQRVPRPARRGL